MHMLSIDASRMKADFDALAAIGATPEGGVHRPAFSEAHQAARRWFRQRAEAAGLEIRIDKASNHSAILRQPGAARTLLVGSHLDSVPYGGRFDGGLGVVAALEVLRTIGESGRRLPVHLEAIDFTDEESSVFDYAGSRSVAGRLDMDVIRSIVSERPDLMPKLSESGFDVDRIASACRDPASLAGYLELHIEQGPRLLQAGVSIGIVESIVGIRSNRLLFRGRADHAGTTPMDARADAGVAASAFSVAARKIAVEQFPGCVATIGRMTFSPGSFNVVPGSVEVTLDIRAPDDARAHALERRILEQAAQEAAGHGCTVDIPPSSVSEAVAMHPRAQQAIQSACDALGLRWMRLPSGAGHDAQMMATVTSAGMIFVPSVGGVSHNPREFTEWDDCVAGANVLLGAALALAEQ
jgi:N-carbamoyl-L-amino-acid hydrolase